MEISLAEAGRICRYYLGCEPFRIEISGSASLTGLSPHDMADVTWQGHWLLRLDGSRRADWLAMLLHELGHIRLGHVPRKIVARRRPDTLDVLVSDALAGSLTDSEARALARRRSDIEAEALRLVVERERAAEAWALERLPIWERLLRG